LVLISQRAMSGQVQFHLDAYNLYIFGMQRA
jgi:hypothetical protein